jgi:hypothetical protein
MSALSTGLQSHYVDKRDSGCFLSFPDDLPCRNSNAKPAVRAGKRFGGIMSARDAMKSTREMMCIFRPFEDEEGIVSIAPVHSALVRMINLSQTLGNEVSDLFFKNPQDFGVQLFRQFTSTFAVSD